MVETAKTSGLPAIYIDSEYLKTDGTWLAGNLIEEYTFAGDTPHYYHETDDPEVFPFANARVNYVSKTESDGGFLFDFGQEIFAKLCMIGADPDDEITVCYGESKEEALDIDNAILFQHVSGYESYTLPARAFRYVHIVSKHQIFPEVFAACRHRTFSV